MHLTRVLASLATVAISGQALHAGVFTDVTLGSAGPGGFNFSMLVTGPTTLQASNSGTAFVGNVGISGGSSTNFSGGGTIQGALYKDPTATVQANLASQFNVVGGVITQNLTQAVGDAVNAWQVATMLAPNQTFGALGSFATIITPTGPLNLAGGQNTVVSVQSITISNPSKNLTISGGPNDWFIINVAGNITVSNGQIAVSGGIPVSHVLFTVGGSMSMVTLTNGSSSLDGTYLAPNPFQQINLTPGTVHGAVIGYQVRTSSGPDIVGEPWTPVPAPGSVGLLGLFALAVVRRNRV